MKRGLFSAAVLTAMVIAGCSGGGSATGSSTTLSGKIADGYLVGATVFLDKNGNFQLDAGEPSTTTDAQGTYRLAVDPADVGNYPIVALAVKGVTVDTDTNQAVTDSYLLHLPAVAVSGTVSNFISPMSTLIGEKMAANPGMTMLAAMTQLRNQMNLPAGLDMMADYMAAQSGPNATDYQKMHATAQQMATLMAAQAGSIMSGTTVNMNRYRSMMGLINSNMSAIAANAMNGQGMNSTFMTQMMSQMQSLLGTTPLSGTFMNYTGMFRNMTSHGSFWTPGGSPMTPMNGGMMH